jgi:AraC-like DNA-binding protein
MEDKVFFTPRHIVHKNNNGETGLEETFYLNNDPPEAADRNIFHCFAFGVSFWGGDWSIRKEYKRYISLNFFLEGSVFLQTGKETLQVKAGDMMVGRRTSMTMRTPAGGMAKKYCLLLSSNLTQSALCDMLTPKDPAVLTMNDPAKIIKLLENIYTLIKNGSSRQELDCAIFIFLQEVQNQHLRQLPPANLLDKALHILRKSDLKLSCAELAAQCNTTPRTLTRIFTRHLNISPGQYIIKCRLEKAAGMLESTDEPIKNIADECGFSTPVFFAREFKQHFNSSPSFYRKQNRSTTR